MSEDDRNPEEEHGEATGSHENEAASSDRSSDGERATAEQGPHTEKRSTTVEKTPSADDDAQIELETPAGSADADQIDNSDVAEAEVRSDEEADVLDEPLERILEAILFAADGPSEVKDIIKVFEKAGHEGMRKDTIHAGLQRLAEEIDARESAIKLTRTGKGWEFRTKSEFAHWVTQLYEKKPIHLTRASLEVLAIVAYKQPCTRAVVDDIRGVDSSSTLRQMLKIGLLQMLGRADDVGRPIVYGTSKEFLRVFGLDSLADLPTLREFAELSEEHMLTLAEFEESLDDEDDEDGDDSPAIDASYAGRDLEDTPEKSQKDNEDSRS
jgi:segregation and condensation protein B